jgi:hypothetical protein
MRLRLIWLHHLINHSLKIQRHGARFPTANAGAKIEAAVAKLKKATQYTDPKLNFLTGYTYDLGEDDLVPFGAAE